MKSLAVAIPVLNQEQSTQETLDSLKQNQSEKDVRYIIIDNGCKRNVRSWLKGLSGDDIVIHNDKNVGLPKALNQALKINYHDYLFATHTDITMFESGWDSKVKRILTEFDGNVGVAGFYGAKGIGTDNIYKVPYQMEQLIRIATIAGDRCRQDPLVHHHRQFKGEWEECAVLDGFSLIVRKDLKFWDKSVHHGYDNFLCLEAINMGLKNIVINMDIQHHGGRTDVGEDWATPFGKTKQQIHAESHIPLYEYWHPRNVESGKNKICLPYSL